MNLLRFCAAYNIKGFNREILLLNYIKGYGIDKATLLASYALTVTEPAAVNVTSPVSEIVARLPELVSNTLPPISHLQSV